MYVENIVIGRPLVDLWLILGDSHEDNSFNTCTIFETEIYLPKILVKYGLFKSLRELKRNRPDLDITLDKIDCFYIKINKNKYFIVSGAKTESEYNKFLN